MKRKKFEEYVAVAPNGCLLWQSRHTQAGYGRFRQRIGKRRVELLAHRVAWERVHGAIPEGFFVCHKCDVPACVNVDHLFLGTPADNTRDMYEKGRQPRNTREDILTEKYWVGLAARRSYKGTDNPNAKLSRRQIATVKRLFARSVPMSQIGKRVGITGRGVALVLKREGVR